MPFSLPQVYEPNKTCEQPQNFNSDQCKAFRDNRSTRKLNSNDKQAYLLHADVQTRTKKNGCRKTVSPFTIHIQVFTNFFIVRRTSLCGATYGLYTNTQTTFCTFILKCSV